MYKIFDEYISVLDALIEEYNERFADSCYEAGI